MAKVTVGAIDGIAAEYVLAPHMVVFSHGFGVRRDTSGFFTEIAEHLPEGYGYVLFDYYDYDKAENIVTLTDFSQQVVKFNKIIDWVRKQEGVQEINIVAHSIGSVVAALAEPEDLAHVILLAPPASIGERTRTYFTSKKGAVRKGGFWIVPRSDGTMSKIPESMFDEFEATSAAGEIVALSHKHPLTIITAAEDEVLDDVDYTPFLMKPGIKIVAVQGANHNFTGKARTKVIQLIRENL